MCLIFASRTKMYLSFDILGLGVDVKRVVNPFETPILL